MAPEDPDPSAIQFIDEAMRLTKVGKVDHLSASHKATERWWEVENVTKIFGPRG